MTRRWCQCGAPLWREDHDKIEPTVDSIDGCRLCGLDWWTSADVLDNAGPADEMVRRMHDRLALTAAGANNSTDDTAATSRMLPVGCREPVDLSGLTGYNGYMVWLKWVWDAA